MRSDFLKRAGRLCAAGILLFALRLAQNKTGFDAETGLSLPSLPGKVLVVCLIAAAVLELVLSRQLDKEKRPFAAQFAPPEKTMTALVLGCMLLAAGGVLLAIEAVSAGGGIASIAAGLLALAAAGGLLILTKKHRADEELTVAPALPAMFFGVFLVLAVYLPAASDPVLEHYYLQVLAAAMAAFAFAQLAGFFRGESSPRSFTPVADLAVITCVAAMADSGRALVLLYGGVALVLTVFLLQRREQIPEE